MRAARHNRNRRRGAAALEVVMIAGLFFTASGLLMFQALRACVRLFHIISWLIGWPLI